MSRYHRAAPLLAFLAFSAFGAASLATAKEDPQPLTQLNAAVKAKGARLIPTKLCGEKRQQYQVCLGENSLFEFCLLATATDETLTKSFQGSSQNLPTPECRAGAYANAEECLKPWIAAKCDREFKSAPTCQKWSEDLERRVERVGSGCQAAREMSKDQCAKILSVAKKSTDLLGDLAERRSCLNASLRDGEWTPETCVTRAGSLASGAAMSLNMQQFAEKEQRVKAICDHILANAKPSQLDALGKECYATGLATMSAAQKTKCVTLYRGRCDGADDTDPDRAKKCEAAMLFSKAAFGSTPMDLAKGSLLLPTGTAALLWPDQKKRLDDATRRMGDKNEKALTQSYLAANPEKSRAYAAALDACMKGQVRSVSCENRVMKDQLRAVRKDVCKGDKTADSFKDDCTSLSRRDAAARAERERQRMAGLNKGPGQSLDILGPGKTCWFLIFPYPCSWSSR